MDRDVQLFKRGSGAQEEGRRVARGERAGLSAQDAEAFPCARSQNGGCLHVR